VGSAWWLAAQSLLPTGGLQPTASLCCVSALLADAMPGPATNMVDPACKSALQAGHVSPDGTSCNGELSWLAQQAAGVNDSGSKSACTLSMRRPTAEPPCCDSSLPADCPAGSHNPGVGASTCLLCPAGTSSQDTGALLGHAGPCFVAHMHLSSGFAHAEGAWQSAAAPRTSARFLASKQSLRIATPAWQLHACPHLLALTPKRPPLSTCRLHLLPGLRGRHLR
jgi:hypothetical protein